MAGWTTSASRTPLEQLAGVGTKTKEKLAEHGISSIEELAAMTPEQLTAIPGIGEKMVQKIASAVKQHFEPEAGADQEKSEPAAAEVESNPTAGRNVEEAEEGRGEARGADETVAAVDASSSADKKVD
jgi:nucleotidyltransferase/DNA polymerase involved in DNA repair